MSSSDQNLSEHQDVPSGEGLTIGIVVSEWNTEITGALYEAAVATLKNAGVSTMDRMDVPGSFELVFGAKKMHKAGNYDAVICLGCIINGETRHFDFIAQAVANGIIDLNLTLDAPTVFGVLTPENMEQALDRAGGKHGNKGIEAAVTALKMCHYNFE